MNSSYNESVQTIDYYEVAITNNNSTSYVQTSSTNRTINNLLPGSVAYIAIRARNVAGYGPYVNTSVSSF